MDASTRTGVYLALSQLAERWAAHPITAPFAFGDLTPTELRVFSQNGEDGVIEAILGRIGSPTRTFVEFGAERGLEGNCAFLAEVLGWSGLFIEADEVSFAVLATRYRDRDQIETRHAAVTPTNINYLLSESDLPDEIDVLSIDIDGHDYWVWQAIAAVRPRLVVIEYNAHFPKTDRRVQPLDEAGPWLGTDYFGASLGALEYLADAKGYRLVHTDLAGVNAFFVRADLVGSLPHGECVPRRAANFFLEGMGHPADTTGRRMIDPGAA